LKIACSLIITVMNRQISSIFISLTLLLMVFSYCFI